ncbi:hypothetical protein [Nocardia sp. BMG111209]|uniref:hypothetical protein n=1 Tax=Nocardia sp. BMG111209 TaxID=1160137 RepID=UPI000372B72B|nr:hypothetical protein [Nocardia sp. BMG111209]
MIGDAVTDAFRLSLLRTERALRMAADTVTDRLYGPMSRRLEATTGRMLDAE